MPIIQIIGELSETGTGIAKRFEWKIPKFSSLNKQTEFLSPSFIFANMPFCIRMNLPDAHFDWFSLYLKSESAFDCNITFSIKKSDGSLICTQTNTDLEPNQFQCFCKKFISGYVMQVYSKHEILPLDTLTIICDLDEKQMLPPCETDCFEEKATFDASEHVGLRDLDTLSENFKNLFNNKESCDTTLLVMEKEYKAHRAVLIARSSVFAAMFQHETSEKQTGIITIPDCDPESFEEFLYFLYSGKLEEPSPRSAVYLYETSEKYNVQILKTYCSKFLRKNLTMEYLFDIVILADKYDDTELYSAAQCFFNMNLNDVFTTSEWKNLMKNKPRLGNKLLIDMSSKVKVLE